MKYCVSKSGIIYARTTKKELHRISVFRAESSNHRLYGVINAMNSDEFFEKAKTDERYRERLRDSFNSCFDSFLQLRRQMDTRLN